MALAIANALLKYCSHTCIFIDSSQINREQPLGEQLFKVTNKIANLKNTGTSFFETKEKDVGTYDAKVASPLLEHLFRWDGAVVIFDEYEKMKHICTSPNAPPEIIDKIIDKSGDEIVKSLTTNGFFMVGTEKIDCTKILFIFTTNETKKQLYENFGQGGIEGGGAQRLNIIEFNDLDKPCCIKIINDMVKNIKERLTDSNGDFKLKYVEFPEETLDKMADYILNDKLKQARAKSDLEQKIYRLFLYELESNINKSFVVNYEPAKQEGKIGIFTKNKTKAIGDSFINSLDNKTLIDFSKNTTDKTVIKSYTGKNQILKDFSKK